MINAQQWLDENYPKNEQGEIRGLDVEGKALEGDLDLSDFVNLKNLQCSDNQLTNLDLSKCSNLTFLACTDNQLTSIDFLTQLPNPKKLQSLYIFSNKIQPTDIAVFSRFVNLEYLKLGTTEASLTKCGKHNQFYGSFQSWTNLTKLKSICIEATNVNTGLEFLPFSLAEATKKVVKTNWNKQKGGYTSIECSPHETNAQCSAIQNQLRPFNYDLLAWQLAHPELMLKSKPEYFTNPASKEQWLTALQDKIKASKETLTQIIQHQPEKSAQIQRLENQISQLKNTETKLKTENEQEKKAHQRTEQDFYQQLKELTTILFPSNNDISTISFLTVKRQVTEMKTKNEYLTNSIENLKSEKEIQLNQSQNTKINEIESNVSTLQTETTEIKSEIIPEIQREVGEVKTENVEIKNRVAEVESKIPPLEQKLENVEFKDLIEEKLAEKHYNEKEQKKIKASQTPDELTTNLNQINAERENEKKKYESTLYFRTTDFLDRNKWNFFFGFLAIVIFAILDIWLIKKLIFRKLWNKFWAWWEGPLNEEDWGWGDAKKK